MNRDVKVGIFVLIVICSGIGFVLLAAPSVKKDSLEDIKPSLFSFSKKSDESNKRAFWDEDLSLEMENPTGGIEITNTKKVPIKKDTFIEISKNNLVNKSNQEPSISQPAESSTSKIKEPEKDLIPPVESEQKNLENDPLVADTNKKEESKITSNNPKDKPLESKVLEDSYYTVKEGDTLSNIARRHYQDSNKHKLISDANKGLKANELKIGMKLFLPGAESQKKFDLISKPLEKPTMTGENKIVSYTVKSGDTISSIARKFFGKNYLLDDFKKANPGKDLGKLKIGQTLNIPGNKK